jgi:hypothetical protein
VSGSVLNLLPIGHVESALLRCAMELFPMRSSHKLVRLFMEEEGGDEHEDEDEDKEQDGDGDDVEENVDREHG